MDVTPVIEWFVAKSILAVSGDVEAMTTLGMIVGGLLVTLFMLRVYITARLASTLGRRRSTALTISRQGASGGEAYLRNSPQRPAGSAI
jgi:uncharacterized membrane protein YciS (DUF1049 family)